MPVMLLWFVKNPLVTLLGAALLALGIYTGLLFVERASLHETVATQQATITTLTVEKAALKSSVDNLNLQVDLAKEAQSALESSLQQQSDRASRLQDSLKEINNAPAKDDGPVAPVLGRTLDRLLGK